MKAIQTCLWNVSGRVPTAGVAPPYATEPFDEPYPEPAVEGGSVVYERDGKRFFHPVATAEHGLALLGQRRADEALACGQAILNHAINGWLAYDFDFPLHGDPANTIHAPWWSAMAQGEALSLSVRLYELTGVEEWCSSADVFFRTFCEIHPEPDLPVGPWVVLVDGDGYLWLEEYAGDVEPMKVLNGHIFAMFGLYDYWALTGDSVAVSLFDGAATTVARYIHDLRVPGQPSFYGMRVQEGTARSQTEHYHRIHIWQLLELDRLTGDDFFSSMAALLASDY